MEKKIKILLSLLLVSLLAVACSKKKSGGDMGILALLLAGSSSSDDAETQEVDITSGFPSAYIDSIAYKLKADSSSNLVSQASASSDWTRLKKVKDDGGNVSLEKDQELEFAIVLPGEEAIDDASIVPMGDYKFNGNKSVTISFTSLTKSTKAGGGQMTAKEANGFVAIAATVKKLVGTKTGAAKTTALDQAKKLLTAVKVKAKLTAVIKAAADASSAQDAVEDAADELKAEVIAKDITDDTIKTALNTAADAAKADSENIAKAIDDSIKKEDKGKDPDPGDSDKPTATLTINKDPKVKIGSDEFEDVANATAALTLTDNTNSKQLISLTLDSDKDDAVFFLYTATEQGTETILLSDAKKGTAVKKSDKTIQEDMNFTSSYVYTLAACKAGTTAVSDTNCSYATQKVKWLPTVVLKEYKDSDGQKSTAKVQLATVFTTDTSIANELAYTSANTTISQVFPADKTGTLTIDGTADLSGQAFGAEITLQYNSTSTVNGADGTGQNVSGTIKVTACNGDAATATSCVQNTVHIGPSSS